LLSRPQWQQYVCALHYQIFQTLYETFCNLVSHRANWTSLLSVSQYLIVLPFLLMELRVFIVFQIGNGIDFATISNLSKGRICTCGYDGTGVSIDGLVSWALHLLHTNRLDVLADANHVIITLQCS
jgi:hypothetical protein